MITNLFSDSKFDAGYLRTCTRECPWIIPMFYIFRQLNCSMTKHRRTCSAIANEIFRVVTKAQKTGISRLVRRWSHMLYLVFRKMAKRTLAWTERYLYQESSSNPMFSCSNAYPTAAQKENYGKYFNSSAGCSTSRAGACATPSARGAGSPPSWTATRTSAAPRRRPTASARLKLNWKLKKLVLKIKSIRSSKLKI